MNEQEIRDALAAVLDPIRRVDNPWLLADALTPVVRRIVAAELRAAGDAYSRNKPGFTLWLRARADELDPQ